MNFIRVRRAAAVKLRIASAGMLLAAFAISVVTAEPAVAAVQPTPSQPGAGYVLDWENRAQWSLPPYGWVDEYLPSVTHPDGEPQVRVASGANGEPVRGGHHSVRFELDKTDPPLNNGARAELGAESPVEPRGAERWYGFSTYLPNTWSYDRAPEIINQWHQVGGDCTQGCSPPLSIITQQGQYWISQNWQQSHTPGDWHFSQTPIGPYQTGRWTDWVVHVKWSTADDGILDIWKDGSPVPGFSHKVGRNDDYGDGVHGNYVVTGIYKWPWSQGQPSDTTRRVMYFDELRITDQRGSYAAVAPGAANPTGYQVSLVGPMGLSPTSPVTGAPVTATFTIRNTGGTTVALKYLVTGARDPSSTNVDFPTAGPVTLSPGQQYTYSATRTFWRPGSYTAWPGWFDGTNWNSLAPPTSFTVG